MTLTFPINGLPFESIIPIVLFIFFIVDALLFINKRAQWYRGIPFFYINHDTSEFKKLLEIQSPRKVSCTVEEKRYRLTGSIKPAKDYVFIYFTTPKFQTFAPLGLRIYKNKDKIVLTSSLFGLSVFIGFMAVITIAMINGKPQMPWLFIYLMLGGMFWFNMWFQMRNINYLKKYLDKIVH